MQTLSQFISYLFPDAASVWGGVATLAGVVGVIYGAMGFHHRRRLDQVEKPIVAVSFDSVKGVENWFEADLTISNPLPFSISCEKVTIEKPRAGISLLKGEFGKRPDLYNWPTTDATSLSSAVVKAQRSIPVGFRIERTGIDAKVHSSGGMRSTGDRETRSFFLLRDPNCKKINKLSMVAQLRYHDSRSRIVAIKFNGLLS